MIKTLDINVTTNIIQENDVKKVLVQIELFILNDIDLKRIESYVKKIIERNKKLNNFRQDLPKS